MKYIILAAGSGTRLWPLSRRALPKQFLHFGDKETLLQKTVKRFYPRVPLQDILIVTHQIYFHLVKSQLAALHPDFAGQILLEPERRNTAPAICLALKYFQDVLKVDANECFLICPADHILSPESLLISTAAEGEEYAKDGHHVLFGIRPLKPETGYGYIKTGSPYKGTALHVEKFVEKPDAATAEQFLRSGNYLWNSGMFLLSLSAFLKESALVYPPFSACSFKQLQEHFSELPATSIDYALMEKSHCNLVIPLSLSWSDVGSWDSVYDHLEKDPSNNVKLGNVVDLGSKNCLIMGNKRLISTIGLEDLIIVETQDALFIGKKGESQKVKTLVEQLNKIEAKESSEHLTTHHPWGTFTILEESLSHKIKRVVMEPGQHLNFPLHPHRNKHWVVIKGTAKVTLGEDEHLLEENESLRVERSQPHRLENLGTAPLELIEIQVGEC